MHRDPVLDRLERAGPECVPVQPKRRVQHAHDPDDHHDPKDQVHLPAGRKHKPLSDNHVQEEDPDEDQNQWHLFLQTEPSSRCDCCSECIPGLTLLKVAEEGDDQQHREEEHEHVLPEEPGEVDQVRGDGDEQRCDDRLALVQIAEPVDYIDQWNDQRAKQRREETANQVGIPKETEHRGREIIEQRPVVHRIVYVRAFGEQLVRKPRMDRFVVVKEFEVELIES